MNRLKFHYLIKQPVMLLQVFGFFPVEGLANPDPDYLNFKWLSWRVFVNLISLAGSTFHLICFVLNMTFGNIVELNALEFHFEGVLLNLLFLHMAIRWGEFVREWSSVEQSLQYCDGPNNAKIKIFITTVSILGVALLEHTVVTSQIAWTSIRNNPGSFFNASREYFVQHEFVEVFHYVPYSIFIGVFFKVLIVQKTFIWSFIDVFIATVSICFHCKMVQISRKVTRLSAQGQTNPTIWRTTREDYNKLSKLCQLINGKLRWLIVLSFFNNVYHILSQLFNSLKPNDDVVHKIYFCLSFALLILRITAVCVFAGSIYDQQDDLITVLTTTPSGVYNIEVERFITHLGTSEMVLSGCNFFKITKGLLLKITSAIVTYELVLIQFNQKEFQNAVL